MPKGEAVGWNDGSGGAGEARTGGNLRDEDGLAQEGVGQCRRQVLREGCSRVSHLAGLAGLDVRVTLYYLALQCRRVGRKSENLVFFSEVASKWDRCRYYMRSYSHSSKLPVLEVGLLNS